MNRNLQVCNILTEEILGFKTLSTSCPTGRHNIVSLVSGANYDVQAKVNAVPEKLLIWPVMSVVLLLCFI